MMVCLFMAILMVLAGFGTYKLIERIIDKDLKNIKIEDIMTIVMILIIYFVSFYMVLGNTTIKGS